MYTQREVNTMRRSGGYLAFAVGVSAGGDWVFAGSAD